MSQSKIHSKHIVIIYENTGGGHLKAAKILQTILAGTAVNITLITASELAKDENNIFVRGWNYFIKKNWLLTADILLNFVLRILLLPLYYSIYPKLIFTELDQLKPDIIISTGDCNRLFGSYCSERNIPFFIFITEAAVFVDMLSTHANHIVYFDEVAKLIRSFELSPYFTTDITPSASVLNRMTDIIKQWYRYSIGYLTTPYFKRYTQAAPQKNNLTTTVIGPIREEEYYVIPDIKQIKQNYNLPDDGHNVLIANGSLGGITLKKILAALQQNNHFNYVMNLLVICGSDEDLYNDLLSKINLNNTIRIIPIAHQQSLAHLYQIADVSIGRGTAGILLDSLVSNTPLIVLKHITANDLGTLDIIKKYGIGEIADNYASIPLLLNKLLTQRKQYMQALVDFSNQYQANNYTLIHAHIRATILKTTAPEQDDK